MTVMSLTTLFGTTESVVIGYYTIEEFKVD